MNWRLEVSYDVNDLLGFAPDRADVDARISEAVGSDHMLYGRSQGSRRALVFEFVYRHDARDAQRRLRAIQPRFAYNSSIARVEE